MRGNENDHPPFNDKWLIKGDISAIALSNKGKRQAADIKGKEAALHIQEKIITTIIEGSD